MNATGEAVRRIADFGYFPTWSPDGSEIICSTVTFERPDVRMGFASRLVRINLSTGGGRIISERLEDAVQPSWSPNGSRVACWGSRHGSRRDLWTLPAEGGMPVAVTDDPALDWNPVWSPDGKYLYFSSDRSGTMNLWRVRLDERTGQVLAPVEAVTTPSPYSGHLSLSRDGRRMAYVQQTRTVNLHHVDFDPVQEKAVGTPVPITAGLREAWYPALSPDGQWLAFATWGKREDLYVIRTTGGGMRQLTDDVHMNRGPQWSPDGKRIAFHSNRSGKFELWVMGADGSGLTQVSEDRLRGILNSAWSPDGTHLVGMQTGVGSSIYDPAKRSAGQPLPPWPEAGLWFAAKSWSPDGGRIAGYLVRSDGAPCGIATFSPDTQRYRRLTDFGSSPHWLSDSRRLLFHHDGALQLLDTATGRRRAVLSVRPNEVDRWKFSVSRDDRRIYFALTVDEADIWMMTRGESGGAR
jgi:TolB protein